jgi:hypothetical protein
VVDQHSREKMGLVLVQRREAALDLAHPQEALL